jgi:hypothetical protein
VYRKEPIKQSCPNNEWKTRVMIIKQCKTMHRSFRDKAKKSYSKVGAGDLKASREAGEVKTG